MIGAIIFIAVFVLWVHPAIVQAHGYIWFYDKVFLPSARAVKGTLTKPITYLAVAAILCVERLVPAKRNQKIFSMGFAQDTVWFIFDLCSRVTIIAAISMYWKAVYDEHFSFLTIHAIEKFPFWVRMGIGILASDFSGWLHHWLRHKISWLWPFHALHHAQKELNMFTDVRYHVIEYAIKAVTNVFFINMFTMNPHAVIYYTVFHDWYTKFCHANIKMNMGFLKYILITPQSHRIHHSVDPHHRDLNYGVLLSIWDYMFRTQYRVYNVYPDAGIDDKEFPFEKKISGWNLFLNPIRQHIYPFKVVINMIKGKKNDY